MSIEDLQFDKRHFDFKLRNEQDETEEFQMTNASQQFTLSWTVKLTNIARILLDPRSGSLKAGETVKVRVICKRTTQSCTKIVATNKEDEEKKGSTTGIKQDHISIYFFHAEKGDKAKPYRVLLKVNYE